MRLGSGIDLLLLTGGLVVVLVRLAAPLRRGDGVDVLDVHGVNLLEGAVLGLDDKEEDNDSQGSTAASEDETVEVVNRIGDVAGEEGHEAE